MVRIRVGWTLRLVQANLCLDHYAYNLSAAQRSAVRIIQSCSGLFPSCESVSSYSTIIEKFPNFKRIYHEECLKAYPPDEDGNAIVKRTKRYGAPANAELIMMDYADPDLHEAQIYVI